MEASQVLDGSHSYESDCIGCSPPPKHKKIQRQLADLEASEDLESASQSQESLDASDSFLPSIPEDDEEAKEVYPGGQEDNEEENAYLLQKMLHQAEYNYRTRNDGNRTLINL